MREAAVSLGSDEELAGPPRVATPTKRGDRISSLDVLRGFALLGILVVNIEDFGGPEALHDIPVGTAKVTFAGPHAHWNLVILLLKWIFVEGKMRGLFSMLFGAGAVLLTSRIERRSSADNAADIFLRRNMWLVALGFLHGTFLWTGDVLFAYGFNALLFLYPCRKLKAKTLFIAGTIVWVGVATAGLMRVLGSFDHIHLARQVSAISAEQGAGKALTPEEKKIQQQWQATVAQNAAPSAKDVKAKVAEGHQGYSGFLQHKGANFLEHTGHYESAFGFTETLGPMLIGMALLKSGFLTAELSISTYLWTAIAGFLVSTPLYIIALWKAYLSNFYFLVLDEWVNSTYHIAGEAGTIAIAATLLFVIKSGTVRSLLRPFAAVGQTALSNYLLTSFLCQMVFVFGPWKLYGELEYHQLLYVVFSVWAVNLLVSPLWLRVFEFGPCEWLWRSLTYWKLQPMRLRREETH
ncbi:MAG TPA: DUF418 domain-containing protein [Bryobacteraceae bacterium]|nr:DUF418 domain-containing protein [Bryobacteraceae bacterium]